jgi:hypothetical protein
MEDSPLVARSSFKGACVSSDLKMYKRFADGRHEGLVDLPIESASAFKQWYQSGGGSHPWQVYRGGNTTHIDLGVTEKADGWSVFLMGSSTSRMAETVRIALALVKEGLPVEIHDAEELRTRLLGMDIMGIIPKFVINHRASQSYEKADRVFDCAHLHDFSRKNRILPFISWKFIDPIRPRIV